MPQPESPYTPEDWARASRIYQAFLWTRLRKVRVYQGENLILFLYFFGLWGLFNILLGFLEPILLWPDWPHAEFPRFPAWPLLATAPIILIKGFAVNHLLSRKTLPESSLPKRLKFIRLALSFLPLLSIALPSLWPNLLSKRFSSIPSAVKLNLTTPPKYQKIRHLHLARPFASGLWLIPFTVAELILLILTVYWLIKADLGQHRRLVITSSCITLHLATLASVMPLLNKLKISRPGSQWQTRVLKLAPYLSLAPIPFPLLAMAPFTYMFKHVAITPKVSQARSWRQLQDVLRLHWEQSPGSTGWRKPWGLQRDEDTSLTHYRFLFPCQLKTLLLVFDAAGLILLLPSKIFGKHPVLSPTDGFKAMLYISFASCAVGLLFQATSVLSRILRISSLSAPLARFPYGWYILLSQLALLTGAYTVLTIYEWHPKPQDFFTIFMLHGLTAVILSAWTGISRSVGSNIRLRNPFSWPFFFLAAGIFGKIASLDPRLARSCLRLLGHSPYLSAIVGILLVVIFGGWLLRPFSWRYVFDRRLPLRFRAALAFMILSAALPLGGLAVPFWIYARHRLWPRYEPLLSSPDH